MPPNKITAPECGQAASGANADALDRRIAQFQRWATTSTMRILSSALAVIALSIQLLAQVEVVPTFTVTTNDVVQSSIMVFRMGGTNEARVTVKVCVHRHRQEAVGGVLSGALCWSGGALPDWQLRACLQT